jgi:hypothetical protein
VKQPLASLALGLAMLLAVPLAGCGEAHVPAVLGGGPSDGPPPVTLHLDSGDVELDAWTWCWDNGCADGAPGDDLTDAGSPETVDFSFPRDDWSFTATFKEHRPGECGRQISVPVGRTDDGTWHLEPAGPAGTWDVDLSGNGDGGDVVTTFTWTTPVDGTLPGPATGSAAVLADHDGRLDSYGVEIIVSDLSAHPRSARASVVVTAADGRSVFIPTRRERGCWSEGSLMFTASDRAGRAATTLGAGPYTYTVDVTLDGTTYTGVGEWPTGETEDFAPHVPLTWTPALPAYTGG